MHHRCRSLASPVGFLFLFFLVHMNLPTHLLFHFP